MRIEPAFTIELKTSNERIAEEIDEVLRLARDKSSDCDSILVIMQRKRGGLLWLSNDSTRLETMCFMASSFLHRLHEMVRE